MATEVGASTTQAGSRDFSEAQQRDWMRYIYDYAEQQSNVDAVVFFTLVEPSGGVDQGFGWVRQADSNGNFYPKRAYCGFANAFAAPINCSAPLPKS
jgi:hypothetical protein